MPTDVVTVPIISDTDLDDIIHALIHHFPQAANEQGDAVRTLAIVLELKRRRTDDGPLVGTTELEVPKLFH